MKRVVIAAILVALSSGALSSSAMAQMGGGRGLRNMSDGKKEEKPKIDEKAYKDALERIPEAKEKYDPWGGVRETSPKAAKTK